MVGLPDGDFAMGWSSFLEDGSGYGIFEQRYNADGSSFGIETRVNNITAGKQYSYPFGSGGQMALLDNGELVNVWSTELGAGEIVSTLTSLPEALTSEDQPLPVNLAAELTDTEGSETLTITLSGFPAGATFSLGAASGSDWVIAHPEGLDLSTLQMTPPADWNGSYTLTASATAAEASNGDTASTTTSATYRILPVEDGPRAEDQVIEVPIIDGLSPYAPVAGALVAVDLNTAPSDGNPAGAISIDLTSYDAPSVNLVFAMDASGRLGSTAWLQQIDAVSNALEDIATRFDGTGIDIDVEVFSYSGATAHNNLRIQFVDGNPSTSAQIMSAPRLIAPSVDLDLTTLAAL
ncbi:von Willebrand factor, type A [Sagittula stellata E-37]|uniref:von Willebrand factor, type A n=1 Tax=Sagittula stellata (strain ATCC 700073 / DSM 11524 / E-37) TaxID=388399 RepID=A3KBA3_SAGS3|nr:von Willebrand factor, type A [Sagittula stellata E-37]